MKIFNNKHKLQKEIKDEKNISFIPTMGGLHKGHISLIKKSKNYKGKCLVTIFVNPKQFNNKKDFNKYPRTLKRDLKILLKLKVNYIYLPKINDVYSFKTNNKVYLDNFSKKLCGKFRKGHFEGVLDVVNRLLEITKPKYMFLGIKDYQQLHLIKKHIERRKIKTQIIPCITVREENGVACSTRNKNLNQKYLVIASNVYWFLNKKKKIINKNLKFLDSSSFKSNLIKLGVTKIDYISLLNVKTMKKPNKKKEKFKIFIAYYLNKVRLIDNI